MGRRNRQREKLNAPTSDYTDAEGNVLTLRGSMTPATRQAYDAVVRGNLLSQEDAWQRGVEFLFERLAVRWVIAGVPIEKQRELLARYRFSSVEERTWIRGALREHLAAHFPEMDAP